MLDLLFYRFFSAEKKSVYCHVVLVGSVDIFFLYQPYSQMHWNRKRKFDTALKGSCSHKLGVNVEVKVTSQLLQPIAKSVTTFVGPYHILGQLVTIISSISIISHSIHLIGCNIATQVFCLQTLGFIYKHRNCNRFSNWFQ